MPWKHHFNQVSKHRVALRVYALEKPFRQEAQDIGLDHEVRVSNREDVLNRLRKQPKTNGLLHFLKALGLFAKFLSLVLVNLVDD